MENTKAWANFKEKKPERKQEVEMIETKSMNKEEKSKLLHEVAKSAEQEEIDSRNPKPVEKSEEEIDQERKD